MPTPYWLPPASCNSAGGPRVSTEANEQLPFPKINHVRERVSQSRELNRAGPIPTGAGVLMSYRTSHYSEYPQHHAHDHGKPRPRRPGPVHVAPPPKAAPTDYTISHAGKQVRV